MAYTQEQKETAVRMREDGMTYARIARCLQVSEFSVRRWYHEYEDTGDLSVKTSVCARNSPTKLDDYGYHIMMELFQQFPTKTDVEIAAHYEEHTGISLSQNTIFRVRMCFGLVKKAVIVDQSQKSPNYEQKVGEFIEEVSNIKPENLFCLDESSVAETNYKSLVTGSVGERVACFVDTSNKNRATVVGVIGFQGEVIHYPYYCSVNSVVFLEFLQNYVFPTIPKGSAIILDNATIHKSKIVQQAFIDAGIQPIWMPPRSPQLNPVEMLWAYVKRKLRAKSTSSLEDLYINLKKIMKNVNAALIKSWFHHSLGDFARD